MALGTRVFVMAGGLVYIFDTPTLCWGKGTSRWKARHCLAEWSGAEAAKGRLLLKEY